MIVIELSKVIELVWVLLLLAVHFSGKKEKEKKREGNIVNKLLTSVCLPYTLHKM